MRCYPFLTHFCNNLKLQLFHILPSAGCNSIACPKTRNYICGSDGKTYRNECQMQKRACKGPHIDVAYNGRCSAGKYKTNKLNHIARGRGEQTTAPKNRKIFKKLSKFWIFINIFGFTMRNAFERVQTCLVLVH